MTFLPPSSDTGAMALLSMVSDPKAYRAKLEEITKANAELSKSIAESRTLQQQVKTTQREILEQRRLLDIDRAEYETNDRRVREEIAKQVKELEEQKAEVHNLTVQARSNHSRSAELETQLNARKVDLDLRERQIKEREQTLTVKEEFVQGKIAEHSERVRRLKEII
jgi:chromosome segregation ATPase